MKWLLCLLLLTGCATPPPALTGLYSFPAAAELHHPVLWLGAQGQFAFLGATVAAIGEVLLRPRRLRQRELAVQLEQTGLNAIPVVALVTALIGVSPFGPTTWKPSDRMATSALNTSSVKAASTVT
jgi:hypothetical protein